KAGIVTPRGKWWPHPSNECVHGSVLRPAPASHPLSGASTCACDHALTSSDLSILEENPTPAQQHVLCTQRSAPGSHPPLSPVSILSPPGQASPGFHSTVAQECPRQVCFPAEPACTDVRPVPLLLSPAQPEHAEGGPHQPFVHVVLQTTVTPHPMPEASPPPQRPARPLRQPRRRQCTGTKAVPSHCRAVDKHSSAPICRPCG